MQIDSNHSQQYLQRLRHRSCAPTVYAIAVQLLDDLLTHGDIDPTQITVRLARQKDLPAIKDIITLSYNARYQDKHQQQLTSFNEVGTSEHITTIVAQHRNHAGHLITLATVRLVTEKLELFDFFSLPPGQTWPYQQRQLTPCEFERLAFHPYFDLVTDFISPDTQLWQTVTKLQASLVHQMFAHALAPFDRQQLWLVCTMNPRVHRYMTNIGIKTRPLTNAHFTVNQTTTYLSTHWPKYFQEVAAYEIL